jgi:hypothetical protein
VFVDVNDTFNGRYTCIARCVLCVYAAAAERDDELTACICVCPHDSLSRAGKYKLYIMVRQQHIMGSPFDVEVRALPPWPPASEYFPVDADGMRSDVQLVIQETVCDELFHWTLPTLQQASRTKPVFLASDSIADDGTVMLQAVCRVPRSIAVPYPDLRTALREIQLRDFNLQFPVSSSVRRPPTVASHLLNPDRTAADLKPVFMYFGRQFHRTNYNRLGTSLRIGIVLRDKCGNVIRDRSWYELIRADIHLLVNSKNYAFHLSTVRAKYRELWQTMGNLDAVLEAVDLDNAGYIRRIEGERSMVPSASQMFEEHMHSLSAAFSLTEHEPSEATDGSTVNGVSQLLMGKKDARARRSPRAQLSRSQAQSQMTYSQWRGNVVQLRDSEIRAALAPLASMVAGEGDDSVDDGRNYTASASGAASPITSPQNRDRSSAIVLQSLTDADAFGLAEDVLDAGDDGDAPATDDAGDEAGARVEPALLVGPSMPTLALPSMEESFQGADVSMDIGSSALSSDGDAPWVADLANAKLMFERFYLDGQFGEVGEHVISVTMVQREMQEPWEGSVVLSDELRALKLQHEAMLEAQERASRRSSRTHGRSSARSSKSGASSGRLVSNRSYVTARSQPRLELPRIAEAAVASVPSLRVPSHRSAVSHARTEVTAGTNSTRKSHASHGRLTQRSSARDTVAGSKLSGVSGLRRGSHSGQQVLALAEDAHDGDGEPSSDSSGVGDVDGDVEQLPLTYNTTTRRDITFRAMPDEYLGLPSLYVVQGGAACVERSVVHYLDPLLLSMARSISTLPAREAAVFVRDVVKPFDAARAVFEKQSKVDNYRAQVPPPLGNSFMVVMGTTTCVGVTTVDTWGNPTNNDVFVSAELRGPDGQLHATVVNVIDLEDHELRGKLGLLMSRAGVASAKNPALHEERKLKKHSSVNTPTWAVSFFGTETGVYELTVLLREVPLPQCPVRIEVRECSIAAVCFRSVRIADAAVVVTAALCPRPGVPRRCFPARCASRRRLSAAKGSATVAASRCHTG